MRDDDYLKALRLADHLASGGRAELPTIHVQADRTGDTLLADAQREYPFIKQHHPHIKFSPDKFGPGVDSGYAETFGPTEEGSPSNPRPSEFPMGETGIEVYRPKEFSPTDYAAEFLHVDPHAHAARDTMLRTLTYPQADELRNQGDYKMSLEQGQSVEQAMRNATDGFLRGYTMGQWPQEAIDQFPALSPEQRQTLDDLKAYETQEPREHFGPGGKAIEDAVRLARGLIGPWNKSKTLWHGTPTYFDPNAIEAGSHFGTPRAVADRVTALHNDLIESHFEDGTNPNPNFHVFGYQYKPSGNTFVAKDDWMNKPIYGSLITQLDRQGLIPANLQGTASRTVKDLEAQWKNVPDLIQQDLDEYGYAQNPSDYLYLNEAKDTLNRINRAQGISTVRYKNACEDVGKSSHIVFDPENLNHISTQQIPFDWEVSSNPDYAADLAKRIRDNRADGGEVDAREHFGPGGKAIKSALDLARGILAYHGSPHKFDRFDISKIGTGEGAQAYGHGLYFAEAEPVAKQYSLNNEQKYSPGAIARRMVNGWGGDRDLAAQKLIERIGRMEGQHDENFMAPYRGALDIIRSGEEPKVGHMYQVRLNVDPEHLLDWDNPIQNQTAFDRLRGHWDDRVGDPDIISQRMGLTPESTGRDLHEALAGHQGNDPRVSKALLDAGIPGTKYLDQGSRASGEGSHNYVMFDDKPIEILKRYEKGGEIREARGPGGELVENALRIASRYRDPATKYISDWKWRPLPTVQREVGVSAVPEHVQNFGRYMDQMSDKAATEGMDPEEALKAYMITRSSIQREARTPQKLEAQGALIRPTTEAQVRPEGQMAEWLQTAPGVRFLNDARKGDLSQDVVDDAMRVMKPFGMSSTEPDAMDWARRHLVERTPLISDMVARARQRASSPDEWRAFTKQVKGIGPAKSGFLASLLGRGDLPTMDARQAILHTGLKNAEAQGIMGLKGGKAGHEAVDRLAARQKAMKLDLPPELDPFYQHLAHHTIWDAVGGEKTTHQDIIDAMRPRAEGGAVDGLPQEVIDALRQIDRERDSEPVMQEYRPSMQERIAAALMPDERPSPERRRLAEGAADLAYFLPGVGEAIAGDRVGREAAAGYLDKDPANVHYLKALRALLGSIPGGGKLAYAGAKKAAPLDDFEDVLRFADRLHEQNGGAIHDALHLAHRLHRGPGGVTGDVSYAPEDMPGDSAHRFIESQLHPDPETPPLVEHYADPMAAHALEANADRPMPSAHEFVQHQLNKQERQLPQMDREAYNAWKHGAPEALHLAAYGTPLAPAAALYDAAQGVASGDPLETALSIAGAPGKYGKAAATALTALTPGSAEAAPKGGKKTAMKALQIGRALLEDTEKVAPKAKGFTPAAPRVLRAGENEGTVGDLLARNGYDVIPEKAPFFGALDRPATVQTQKNLAEKVTDALRRHTSMSAEGRRANSREMRERLAPYMTNPSSKELTELLTDQENAKLNAAREIGLEWNGEPVETTGLPLSPGLIWNKLRLCANNPSCVDACNGKKGGNYYKTGGGNDIYGLMAGSGSTNYPRVNALARSIAFMQDPEAFAVHLYNDLKGKQLASELRGSLLGARLNTYSDLHPSVFKAFHEALPDLSFYDYTKLKGVNPISPNHHLTYSSTGISTPEVFNPHSNWREMRDRLENGQNVAMAFSHKKLIPHELHDEETDRIYRIVSGIHHDFRPADAQPKGEKGVIVGLKNMDAGSSEAGAHAMSKGFIVPYNPEIVMENKRQLLDAEGLPVAGNRRVIIPDQRQFTEGRAEGGRVSKKWEIPESFYWQQFHNHHHYADPCYS